MGEPVIRDWFYRSGDIFLPRKYVDVLDTYLIGNKRSVFYINYWTFMHILSGVFFAWLTPFPQDVYFHFFVGHTIWEMWQIVIGMTPMSPRGFLDIGVDTLAGMLGVYVFLQLKTNLFE